jgi:O-antigen ligase
VSIAYVVVPVNSYYLDSPIRVVYQLYRYCWKDPLLYLIGAVFAGPLAMGGALVGALMATASLVSVQAIFEGYAGLRAAGPFSHGNALGGFLVLPLFIAASFAISERVSWKRALFAACALLQTRALMFTESRGAWVGCVTGGTIMLALSWRRTEHRRRLRAAMAFGLLGLLLLPIVRPNFTESAFAQRFATLTDPGNEGNLVWRYDRWTYFWNVAWEHPLFGVGEVEDESLEGSARTPHNGYLAQWVMNGLPSVTLVVLFGVLFGRRLLSVMKTADGNRYALALGTFCGLVGLAIHNLDDATLQIEAVNRLFWGLAGVTIGGVWMETAGRAGGALGKA